MPDRKMRLSQRSGSPAEGSRGAVPEPGPERLDILLVEPNRGEPSALNAAFAEADATCFQVERAGTLGEALSRLEAGGIDVVLLDLELPDAPGLQAVRRVQAIAPGLSIVVLTERDADMARQAIQEGVQDYLVKGELCGNLLLRAVFCAVERRRLSDRLIDKAVALERATERLRELDRLKDEFISRVSHELRTPLSAIHQFVTILLDGLSGDLGPEQREYLHIVLRNSNQIRNLVNELIEATRADTAKLVVQPRYVRLPDLVQQVRETLDATAAAKGIAIEVQLPESMPPVYADPQRVQQVLNNLIDNAVKFTPEGGHITVRAREESPEWVRISVGDTGIGVRAEARERIFERLYQDESGFDASRKGLGLGLYICRQLVSCMGGRIEVESEVGRGSTFAFTLPVYVESHGACP